MKQKSEGHRKYFPVALGVSRAEGARRPGDPSPVPLRQTSGQNVSLTVLRLVVVVGMLPVLRRPILLLDMWIVPVGSTV